jgi:hypothetical protein
MILWAAVEGRMASMLAGTNVDQLAAPLSLPDVPAAARAIANRVGVDLGDATPVLGRADLTADVIVLGGGGHRAPSSRSAAGGTAATTPSVVRIERQWAPSRKPIIDSSTHERLADEFSRVLRHWLTSNVVVPADGPPSAST